MQRANELCGQIKALMLEKELAELALYAYDFCGSNTFVDNIEDFIAAFGDTLPWDEMDIDEYTEEYSYDLYGTLEDNFHHEGRIIQIIRQIRDVDGALVFNVERRSFISDDSAYYEESKASSLEQLIEEFGAEEVAKHLERIYGTLTSSNTAWIFELNRM